MKSNTKPNNKEIPLDYSKVDCNNSNIENLNNENWNDEKIPMSKTLILQFLYLVLSVFFKLYVVDIHHCSGAAFSCLNFIFYSFIALAIFFCFSNDLISIVWDAFAFFGFVYAWFGYEELDQCVSLSWFIYSYLVPYTFFFGYLCFTILVHLYKYIINRIKKQRKSNLNDKLAKIEMRAQKLLESA